MSEPRPDKIVGILRGFLCDLNVSSQDLRRHVRDRGYCVDCYRESEECQCSGDEDEEHEEGSCQAEEEDDGTSMAATRDEDEEEEVDE